MRSQLARKLVKGEPSKMLTLTCRHEVTPAHQLNLMRDRFERFMKDLRKEFGGCEYARLLEECKDGYPHFHLLARCAYVPQDWISRNWHHHLGADITDIRKCHGKSIGYVTKYVAKAFGKKNELSLNTRQRCAISKNYILDKTKPGSEFLGFERNNDHPVPYANEHYTDTLTLQRRRRNCYDVVEREAGDELPAEFAQPVKSKNEKEDDQWDFDSIL